MTATATLMKLPVRPDMSVCAAALLDDAKTLAYEWSVADTGSMIGKDRMAADNAVQIVLAAAFTALRADWVHEAMAGLLSAYIKGHHASMTPFRDDDTDQTLEESADLVEHWAGIVAHAFRDEVAK